MSFLQGYAKKLGVTDYLGTWNASTNTPLLTSSIGDKGSYYIVSVAGATNINGISDWDVGDWAIFNGSVWQKIDNSELVTKVSGKTGDVVLVKQDVGLENVPNIDATSRSNHTGTQLASTISDFNEAAQDAVGLALNSSANISFSYPDELNQISANLTDTGVAPGNYNLVTVDSKGRITGGTTTGPATRYIGITSVAVVNTTVTYTTVASLTTASLLPGIYRFNFRGLMQSAATNTGVGVRISNVSAAVSTTYAQWAIRQGANGTAANFVYDQLAVNTNVTSASVAAANTNFTVLGEGIFRVTTAGTVAIQIRSETAGTAATLQPDAVLTVELIQ